MSLSESIRGDFPILKRDIQGRPLVYLDNAATSQKPASVLEAVRRYYEWSNANVHRSIHTLGEEATELLEGARDRVRAFIRASRREEIIFTRGTTEAINLVAHAWGRKHLRPGDEILLTVLEHHSNLIPWQLLAKERGVSLRFLEITDEGLLDLKDLDRLLTEWTKLLAVAHVSNVLGTITPVKELIRAAHERGAVVVVDGAQSIPHMPVDVQELDSDFLAFSGHKMLGPMGIGVLHAKMERLEEMDPFLGGGEMIREVWLDQATWNDLPWRFEAGTPPVAGAVGLAAAIDYLERVGMKAVQDHEREITAYALEGLAGVKDLTIYGPRDPKVRGGLVAFNMKGIHPHDLAAFLDQEGIAIRAGHHCAQPLMRRLGVSGTARASFYLYNIKEEVDILVRALRQVPYAFGRPYEKPLTSSYL